MSAMKQFNPTNPTGQATGMEPVRLDILQAGVANAVKPETTPVEAPTSPLVAKNLRLPADLVDFIDFVYTKDRRMKKQDAYTQALEAYFRPLMAAQG